MRTLKYIFAIAVILGFIGYVCFDIFFPNGFNSGDDNQNGAAKKTVLNIGAPNNIASLPIWVAEEDSIFDSLQVDITVKDYTDPLTCDVAFAEGKINLEITDPKRADWLKAAKRVGFKELQTLPMPYAMVACHNSRIANIKQLKAKHVSYTRNSTFQASLKHCLDSVRMSSDSIYMVQASNPNTAMIMLHNSALDAAFIPEPYISLAKAMGHNLLYTNYVKARLIAKNELTDEQLKAFNKAYEEALKRIRKNGVGHYTELIARHCKCSAQFDKQLNIKF